MIIQKIAVLLLLLLWCIYGNIKSYLREKLYPGYTDSIGTHKCENFVLQGCLKMGKTLLVKPCGACYLNNHSSYDEASYRYFTDICKFKS